MPPFVGYNFADTLLAGLTTRMQMDQARRADEALQQHRLEQLNLQMKEVQSAEEAARALERYRQDSLGLQRREVALAEEEAARSREPQMIEVPEELQKSLGAPALLDARIGGSAISGLSNLRLAEINRQIALTRSGASDERTGVPLTLQERDLEILSLQDEIDKRRRMAEENPRLRGTAEVSVMDLEERLRDAQQERLSLMPKLEGGDLDRYMEWRDALQRMMEPQQEKKEKTEGEEDLPQPGPEAGELGPSIRNSPFANFLRTLFTPSIYNRGKVPI